MSVQKFIQLPIALHVAGYASPVNQSDFIPLSDRTYPGYYIQVSSKSVWSIKGGTLKPIKFHKSWRITPAGYPISINGYRRVITKEYIFNAIAAHDRTKSISAPPLSDIIDSRHKRTTKLSNGITITNVTDGKLYVAIETPNVKTVAVTLPIERQAFADQPLKLPEFELALHGTINKHLQSLESWADYRIVELSKDEVVLSIDFEYTEAQIRYQHHRIMEQIKGIKI